MAVQPTLMNSLSDLASQLSKIQDENDTIRQRYLELEDAWQTLGAENKELRAENTELKVDNEAKTTALTTAEARVAELETKLDEVHAAFLEQRNLAEETKTSLVSEQLELQSKTMEGDMLRREGVSQEQELRNLREAWNERESRISRLEEQRNFYEQQLGQLAEAYQIMVDRLTHVSLDYNVNKAPKAKVSVSNAVYDNYKSMMATRPIMSPSRSMAFPVVTASPKGSPRASPKLSPSKPKHVHQHFTHPMHFANKIVI